MAYDVEKNINKCPVKTFNVSIANVGATSGLMSFYDWNAFRPVIATNRDEAIQEYIRYQYFVQYVRDILPLLDERKTLASVTPNTQATPKTLIELSLHFYDVDNGEYTLENKQLLAPVDISLASYTGKVQLDTYEEIIRYAAAEALSTDLSGAGVPYYITAPGEDNEFPQPQVLDDTYIAPATYSSFEAAMLQVSVTQPTNEKRLKVFGPL